MTLRASSVVLALLLTLSRPAVAQCPDGSAPPCQTSSSSVLSPTNTVAVLYFDNQSSDSTDAFLAEGLTEAIIDRLGRVSRLSIKSREAVQKFRERRGEEPRTIGRMLHSAYLVSGGVRHSDGRLRVTVELVQSSNGVRLWGEIYDRTEKDLFALESEIAEAVVSAITGHLLPTERKTISQNPTGSLEAYTAYLKGRFELARPSEQTARVAIGYYKRAIALDSDFAAPYSGLADAYGLLADYQPPRDLLDSMRAATNHALRLQPQSADAWNALGMIHQLFDWDFAAAEQSFRHAIDIAPTNADAHGRLSSVLVFEGRFAEAIQAAQRAAALDSGAIGNYVGILILSRHYADAAALADSMFAKTPADMQILLYRGFAKALVHECDGLAGFERGGASMPNDPVVMAFLANAYIWCDHTDRARELLEALRQRRLNHYVPAISFAYIFAGLREPDSAFAWLEHAFDERSAHISYLTVHPVWDPIRADARFIALLKRTGLTTR